MLKFERHNDCYRIIETIMSFNDTKVKTIDYSLDLQQVKVNNDPWRKTSASAREWFNKYYRHRFKAK